MYVMMRRNNPPKRLRQPLCLNRVLQRDDGGIERPSQESAFLECVLHALMRPAAHEKSRILYEFKQVSTSTCHCDARGRFYDEPASVMEHDADRGSQGRSHRIRSSFIGVTNTIALRTETLHPGIFLARGQRVICGIEDLCQSRHSDA